MQRLGNSVPFFTDARGYPLTGGYIYVGEADADPVTSPIDLFWDVALSVPATQPLRTIGGLIVNGTTPAAVFLAETDYSQTAQDENGVQVDYSESVFSATSGLQPLSSILTAISALAATDYGLALLELANQAALKEATGIPDPLPISGGTVTGGILRQGAGAYLYWADSDQAEGRVFTTANGGADPTSQPGDVWFEEEA